MTQANSTRHVSERAAHSRATVGSMVSSLRKSGQYKSLKKNLSKMPDLVNRYPMQSLIAGFAAGFIIAKALSKGSVMEE